MEFSLLSAARAACAWDLVEGTEFTREGDYMRELVVYTSHRAVRKGWSTLPCYQRHYNSVTDDLVAVRFDTGEQGSSWTMRAIQVNAEDVYDSCQQLTRMYVLFEWGAGAPLPAWVTYLTRCDTLDGFFYVSFFRWTTRCRSAEECVCLFDAMAADIGRLVSAEAEREDNCCVIEYLLRECIPLEQDSVRRDAMRRKVLHLTDATVTAFKLSSVLRSSTRR